MPGMRMSLMIKSGSACASLTIASAPLRAVVTSNPSALSNASSARKRLGSSSTINSRLGILVLLTYPLLVFSPFRQPDRKRTSHAGFALDRDPSAQLLDETLDHVQAQANTRFHFPIHRAALIKAFENMRQLCGTDTATIVLY